MADGPLRATVITDASYCHITKAGGYGAWITTDVQRVRRGGRLKGSPVSAAHAELLAALNGIWIAVQLGAVDILLQTDNAEVVSVIRGEAKSPSRALIAEYESARGDYFPNANMRAKHVKGHTSLQDSRSYVNRWCDTEAGKHMRELRIERGLTKKPRKKRRPKAKTTFGQVNLPGYAPGV